MCKNQRTLTEIGSLTQETLAREANQTVCSYLEATCDNDYAVTFHCSSSAGVQALLILCYLLWSVCL